MDKGYKIYLPNRQNILGLKVWPEMFRELWLGRGLVRAMIVRDISARYKQSFLGLIWSLLSPLVMIFLFLWIKKTQVLPIGETNIPYASFLVLGQIVWFFFYTGIISSANSLVESGQLINKANFPKEIMIISSMGQGIFDLILRLPILLAVFVLDGFVPNPGIFLALIVFLPMSMLIMGLGLWLAALNAILRDIGPMVGLLLNVGIFATPVFYPPPDKWPISFIVNFVNPISAYLNAIRDLSSTGTLSDPVAFAFAVVASVLIFFLSWRVFHFSEQLLAEKV